MIGSAVVRDTADFISDVGGGSGHNRRPLTADGPGCSSDVDWLSRSAVVRGATGLVQAVHDVPDLNVLPLREKRPAAVVPSSRERVGVGGRRFNDVMNRELR